MLADGERSLNATKSSVYYEKLVIKISRYFRLLTSLTTLVPTVSVILQNIQAASPLGKQHNITSQKNNERKKKFNTR